MVDTSNPDPSTDDSSSDASAAVQKRTRRRAASRPAGPPVPVGEESAAPSADSATAEAPAVKKAVRKASKKASESAADDDAPAGKATKSSRTAKATKADKAAKADTSDTPDGPEKADTSDTSDGPEKADKPAKATRKSSKRAGGSAEESSDDASTGTRMASPAFVAPLFQAPVAGSAEAGDAPGTGPDDGSADDSAPKARRSRRRPAAQESDDADDTAGDGEAEGDAADASESSEDEAEDGGRRRRRRRGGRRRRRGGDEDADGSDDESGDQGESGESEDGDGESEEGGVRRRRRRRRRGSGDDSDADDSGSTTTRVREPRSRGGDDVTSLKGSTRLEAKKQRRREGREAGRRRAPILTEAEFLARRESVERVMVVRQHGDRTQIAVLEDGVLVEHYVTRGTSGSMVGNVYLGRVQNVLPSMEAAFVDIGRGRNAVLYAGEVNWDAAGLEGQPKRIEFALKSGDPVLVQVTKDPVGQKGARLTSQISLPGRFLVFVPDGSMTGISRKLPDNERSRLKKVLKRVMPEDAGVIVRTAAEGAPDEALEADVERLKAQWADISAAATSASPPELLYSEPDLAIKVVRDIFNEDVTSLIVSGDSAWTALSAYIGSIAPDLADRLKHWVEPKDVFAAYRVEEQLMKALDRKVHLPSGGSLVIDRTEAMTVVDVNTGKFTGQGGNLEQTVTRNNLEAAEEIVRQLRLRDIGGIIVVDFIDMVLESNRDLVLRRLVECLGRDRTKHQVAEVTSLGLVQMTRKRIGSGLLESFSETCDHCNGRGIRVSLTADHVHDSPKGRKPAGFVDPAEAAARALAAAEQPEDAAAAEQPEDAAAVEQPEDVPDDAAAVEQPEDVPEDAAAAEQPEDVPEGDDLPEGAAVGAV